MRYAIIAAGEGTRLSQEGVTVAKPMVAIGGEPLLCRLVRIFNDNGASHVVVALRDSSIAHLPTTEDTTIVYCSTPSSMHSFWALRRWLEDAPFILTTVDTIFREQEFTEYVHTFRSLTAQSAADGLMGVTDYIDDERPLYVDADDELQITGFTDTSDHPHYVSAGIYGLTPRCFEPLSRCVERGEQRMRNFQRSLVAEGFNLKAWPFSKVLDVDHVSDIQKAEKFLSL